MILKIIFTSKNKLLFGIFFKKKYEKHFPEKKQYENENKPCVLYKETATIPVLQ